MCVCVCARAAICACFRAVMIFAAVLGFEHHAHLASASSFASLSLQKKKKKSHKSKSGSDSDSAKVRTNSPYRVSLVTVTLPYGVGLAGSDHPSRTLWLARSAFFLSVVVVLSCDICLTQRLFMLLVFPPHMFPVHFLSSFILPLHLSCPSTLPYNAPRLLSVPPTSLLFPLEIGAHPHLLTRRSLHSTMPRRFPCRPLWMFPFPNSNQWRHRFRCYCLISCAHIVLLGWFCVFLLALTTSLLLHLLPVFTLHDILARFHAFLLFLFVAMQRTCCFSLSSWLLSLSFHTTHFFKCSLHIRVSAVLRFAVCFALDTLFHSVYLFCSLCESCC